MKRGMRYRFGVINKICFGGRLKPIPIRIMKKSAKTLGYFEYGDTKQDLAIEIRNGNEGDMTITLLHEMIHYRQYLSKKKVVHDKKFKEREWKLANKLKKHFPEMIGRKI